MRGTSLRFLFIFCLAIFASGCDSAISSWVNLRSSGKSPEAAVVIPIVLSPNSNLNRMTGESLSFSATGGIGSLLFSDSGSGYMNSSTGIYSIPLGASSGSEIVKARDSFSNSASATVNIQKMQTASTMESTQDTNLATRLQAITISPNGTIWAAMSTYYEWQILKSIDNGATYTIVDSFIYSYNEESRVSFIKAKDDLTVFVVGKGEESGMSGPGIVRRTLDGGTTWTTVDTYYVGGNGIATGIEFDNSGAILISGGTRSGNVATWDIRRSTDNGNTWTTVYTTATANPGVLAKDSVTGYLYAVGSIGWLTYSARVLKSTDGGLNWSSMGDYAGAQNRTSPQGLAVRNNIVVASGVDTGVGSSPGGSCGGSTTASSWWTRVSSDGGSTWNTAEYFQKYASRGSSGGRVAISPSGNIFVGGAVDSANTCGVSLVRKSTNNGVSWADTFEGTIESGDVASTGFTILNSKLILGMIRGGNHSVIESTDEGLTWSSASIPLVVPKVTTANQVISLSDNSLLAVGSVGESTPNTQNNWLTRRSTDLGQTWTTLDQGIVGSETSAAGVVEVSAGTWFTIGSTYSAGNRWIIRKTTDSGTSWTTVDSYQCPPTQATYGSRIGKDSSGRIYAMGFCTGASGGYSGVIRMSSDAGATWTTVHSYQPASTNAVFMKAIVADSSDNVYVYGLAQDAGGSKIFILKSTDHGVSWNAVLNESIASDFYYEVLASDMKFTETSLSSNLSAIQNAILITHLYKTGGVSHWQLRASFDGGITWSVIKDQAETSAVSSANIILTSDSLNIQSNGAKGSSYYPSFGMLMRRTRDLASWPVVEFITESVQMNSAIACGADRSRICMVGETMSRHFAFVYYWTTRLLSP